MLDLIGLYRPFQFYSPGGFEARVGEDGQHLLLAPRLVDFVGGALCVVMNRRRFEWWSILEAFEDKSDFGILRRATCADQLPAVQTAAFEH